jgi:hypothetical protein
VGFWDVLRGGSRPKPPKLDQLFALPGAAISLQTALGFTVTGAGSVCYRAAQGRGALETASEASALVGLDAGPRMQSTMDQFGYTWLTVRTDPPDVGSLVTDLHAVNASLETDGYGSGLLCSVVAFRSATDAPAYLVYLYKQGTFYPFAPTGNQRRDALLERQMRDAVQPDLPLEDDTSRWLPLWDLPL